MLHETFLAGYPPASLADPPGSSVIVAAVSWLEGTLLGTVATTIAVIAVATVGFMMLAGRVNVRYGATVVVGSFILFGASTIVAGLRSSVEAADLGTAPHQPPPIAPAPAAPPPPDRNLPANTDPYAGASVPTR
jgi:type IV secretory pathway VirB2 component (pilin)